MKKKKNFWGNEGGSGGGGVGEREGKMVLKDATRGEGRGGSREREESGKCTFFFFVVGAHARAIVSSHYLISKFFFSNGNKTSECEYVCICIICVYVHTCILLERVVYVYRCNELVLCLLCVMYTRVNICVLRDNDFSGITL